MSIHIGTSGWHYSHWLGDFYPEGTRPEAMLSHYAGVFAAVEVNSSFYREPEHRTLVQWKQATPPGFLFAYKASRYVTHMKKLHDAARPLRRTLSDAAVLEEKLGPVLFQLPPRWRVNVTRLESFLGLIPRDVRVVFEFRDASWFVDQVYEVLRRHDAALCIYDRSGESSPRKITSGLVYIRFHGADEMYGGSYGERALSGWADFIAEQDREARDVFCFFNNDAGGHAVRNAQTLKAMLE